MRDDLARALHGQILVAAFVQRLADQQGVTGEPTALDTFAFHASRLSNAEVQPDRTSDLVVALSRKKVVTPQESMRLHAEHMGQQKE